MPSDFDRRVEALFDELLDLPEAVRRRRLDGIDDDDLRRRVESLLGSHDDAPSDFLTSPFAQRTDPWEFGEFTMRRRLGWGGMGEVWLAEQKSLGRDVAVKVLNPSSILDPDLVERFQREGLAGGLRHPHIIRLIDMGSTNQRHYVVMEYVDGCTLRDVLAARLDSEKTDRLPAFARPLVEMPTAEFNTWVSEAVAKIADALQYAHDHGVHHRDVKPENILIDERREPVLIDFGLAKSDEAGPSTLTATDQLMGTVYYMSPEQAVRRKYPLDHRTDVFSLGVVLFESLTLSRPFTGDSNAQVVSSILSHRPQFVDRVSPEVSGPMAAVVARAMRKDPANRFQSASDMNDAIVAVLAGRPIVAPPGWVDRWRVYAAHHRPLVRAVTAAAAALAIVVGTAVAYPVVSDYLSRPKLTVEVKDASFVDVAGARVWLQPRAAYGYDVGEPIFAGLTPLRGVRVPPGRYWVQITHDSAGQAELDRHLMEGVDPTLRAVLRTEPISVDMVDVPESTVIADWDCLDCRNEEQAEWPTVSSLAPVGAFSIGRTEVPNALYESFLADTAFARWVGVDDLRPHFWPDGPLPDEWQTLPASGMSKTAAQTFAEWAGGRLPNALEWQAATRTPNGYIYPWGDTQDDPPGSRAVYGRKLLEPIDPLDPIQAQLESSRRSYLAGVEPVNSFPQGETESGLRHALGNVDEWTSSLYITQIDGKRAVDPNSFLAIGSHWHNAPQNALLNWQAPTPDGGFERTGLRLLRRTLSPRRPS